MSEIKNKDNLIAHKKVALNSLEMLLDSYISSDNPSIQSKADKLSYWLEDYSKFLTYEKQFSPLRLKRYKRGDIIKVHLGYNISSEEGGLHYCVVLDKINNLSSPTITVAPLTSVKKTTDISKLHRGSIYLGNSLYNEIHKKFNTLYKKTTAELNAQIELQKKSKSITQEQKEQIENIKNEIKLLNKTCKEIIKMKEGSIILVSQITTVSKIRIYDPKTKYDVLSNIRLSNENLDKIDEVVKTLYTK